LFQQRVIHDASIIAALRKTSRAKGSRTDAIFASVPEPMRQRLGKKPSALSGGCLVTLATLGRVEVDAAEHHGERHGIDFDRQGSGVPVTR
jgi:hypothetical protein